jgi:hypothetical protein
MRVGLILNISSLAEAAKLTIASGVVYADRCTKIPLRAFLETSETTEEAMLIAAEVNSNRAANAAMARKGP